MPTRHETYRLRAGKEMDRTTRRGKLILQTLLDKTRATGIDWNNNDMNYVMASGVTDYVKCNK